MRFDDTYLPSLLVLPMRALEWSYGQSVVSMSTDGVTSGVGIGAGMLF